MTEIEHKCGICGKKATVGPHAGGPITWYCENCKFVVHKFCEELEKYNEFMKEYRKKEKARKVNVS